MQSETETIRYYSSFSLLVASITVTIRVWTRFFTMQLRTVTPRLSYSFETISPRWRINEISTLGNLPLWKVISDAPNYLVITYSSSNKTLCTCSWQTSGAQTSTSNAFATSHRISTSTSSIKSLSIWTLTCTWSALFQKKIISNSVVYSPIWMKMKLERSFAEYRTNWSSTLLIKGSTDTWKIRKSNPLWNNASRTWI